MGDSEIMMLGIPGVLLVLGGAALMLLCSFRKSPGGMNGECGRWNVLLVVGMLAFFGGLMMVITVNVQAM